MSGHDDVMDSLRYAAHRRWRTGDRLRSYARYLWYVLRHKYFVFLACCKYGVPLAGITHDLSKFLPGEFFPYARYFYGPNSQTRTQTPLEKVQFDRAWIAHQHRNWHHPQSWVLRHDDGGEVVLDMPDRYRREMLADWEGAGRAKGRTDLAAWYAKKGPGLPMTPLTRIWVERQLGIAAMPASPVWRAPEP